MQDSYDPLTITHQLFDIIQAIFRPVSSGFWFEDDERNAALGNLFLDLDVGRYLIIHKDPKHILHLQCCR